MSGPAIWLNRRHTKRQSTRNRFSDESYPTELALRQVPTWSSRRHPGSNTPPQRRPLVGAQACALVLGLVEQMRFGRFHHRWEDWVVFRDSWSGFGALQAVGYLTNGGPPPVLVRTQVGLDPAVPVRGVLPPAAVRVATCATQQSENFARHAVRQRYTPAGRCHLTSTRPAPLRPKISGAYMHSALAGGSRNQPRTVARSR